MTIAEMILVKLQGHGSMIGSRAIAAAIVKDQAIVDHVLDALQLGGLVDTVPLGDGAYAWELTGWGLNTAARIETQR